MGGRLMQDKKDEDMLDNLEMLLNLEILNEELSWDTFENLEELEREAKDSNEISQDKSQDKSQDAYHDKPYDKVKNGHHDESQEESQKRINEKPQDKNQDNHKTINETTQRVPNLVLGNCNQRKG